MQELGAGERAGREPGDRAGHFSRSSVLMRKTVAPEAPWVSQRWLETPTSSLVVILFINKREGTYCTQGGRSGKKSVNKSSGAKKLGSETIDGKGGRWVGREL